jgi:type II secretory pathway pseudopilin PulG
VIVALGVMSIVMTAVSAFLVRSISVVHQEGQRQTAIRLASDAMERVRALQPRVLLTGRDNASVDNQVQVGGVAAYLAAAERAYDPGAAPGAGADAALPTIGMVTTLNGVAFTQYWYVVTCWQAPGGGACNLANKALTRNVELLRVVIAVTWRGRECPSGDTCSFFTSSLFSAKDDPIFGATPAPTSPGPGALPPAADVVQMGSACNEFGDDPDPTSAIVRSPTCGGNFWANIDGPSLGEGGHGKSEGDAYQDTACDNGSVEGCTGSVNPGIDNDDFRPDGYFYTVHVTAPLPALTIEVFDPALVNTGEECGNSAILDAAATTVTNNYVTNPAQRYADGEGPYCVSDDYPGRTTETPMITQFGVRSAGQDTGGNPASYPLETRCGQAQPQKFPGYVGPARLSTVLDRPAPGSTYDYVARVFRRWVPLCTITGPVTPGDYLIQVTSYGTGADHGQGENGFSLRAYVPGGPSALNDSVAISGRGRMGLSMNRSATTAELYLARVPSSAAGQKLTVKLWDMGDASRPGTVRVVPAADSTTSFTGCVGAGPRRGTGTFAACSFTVDSSFNGRWETLTIPVPLGYTCADKRSDGSYNPAGCWLRLSVSYPGGTWDTTSWEASMGGA